MNVMNIYFLRVYGILIRSLHCYIVRLLPLLIELSSFWRFLRDITHVEQKKKRLNTFQGYDFEHHFSSFLVNDHVQTSVIVLDFILLLFRYNDVQCMCMGSIFKDSLLFFVWPWLVLFLPISSSSLFNHHGEEKEKERTPPLHFSSSFWTLK